MRLVLEGLGALTVKPDMDSSLEVPQGFVKTEVLACAICRTDAKMWEQGHRDLVFPRVPGHEMVVKDQSGQRYAVWPGKSCGECIYCLRSRENLCEKMKITGFHSDGGFASSAILPAKSLLLLPDRIDDHIGCFAEPVSCAVNAFEKVKIKGGERVLIYGAGTMGLIVALYAQSLGLQPVLLEKNESKIDHISPFLDLTDIPCEKEITDSQFDIVINSCADYIAFCQAITKVAKGGTLLFFSGITKNEHIESNLINLLHYKEVVVAGIYGMTSDHMKSAIDFMVHHGQMLRSLIEEVVTPIEAVKLMPKVLAGSSLKYILDFRQEGDNGGPVIPPREEEDKKRSVSIEELDNSSLCRSIIESITPLSADLLSKAIYKIDNKTKPIGALGRLEPLGVKLSCIQNSLQPQLKNKYLFVFAGDHGVTEEGVSAYPAEVTGQMVENFLNGGAAINVLCNHHSINMNVVDMGVKVDLPQHEALIDKKIAYGTANFALDDAMDSGQMVQAIEAGMQVFLDAYEKEPIDIVGLGEMGIGNTTSASAIISAVTGLSVADAVGRGTGVDDKGLEHKVDVIKRVLAFHKFDKQSADGFEILQKIGGFEIAGIVGAVLAASSKNCCVVLDGVISTAAGLLAYLIEPAIVGYLVSGHKSVEKSQAAALNFMGLDPLIDLDMRLGEGTGSAIAIDLADAACKIMCQMASFDEAKVARSK